MSSGLLSLKWNNHRTTFFHVLSTIRSKDSYSDVTLACEGRFYSLHKFVLATCSEYFEQIFQKTQCKHPVIVLKDISYEDLEALLNYMYIGEVNVVQEKLSGLIKAAECLRIKGLAVPDEEEALSTKEEKTNSHQQHAQKRPQRSEDSPRAKRRRRNASTDGPTEDASDHDRSLDASKFKSSNQQYNSSFKRHSSLNDNDRGLSQENNELPMSSHSSIISSRISRVSNECRDNIDQVDRLSDVKTEPLELEVVSVLPEIPLTPPDTKEGILEGLMEDNVWHDTMDGSCEDFHGQPVEGTSTNCPQEALWKAESSCSYEALEDASAASVQLYSGVIDHPPASSDRYIIEHSIISPENLSPSSTFHAMSKRKSNVKSTLIRRTSLSLSSNATTFQGQSLVSSTKHQDQDGAFNWLGLTDLDTGSGSSGLPREGSSSLKKWQCSMCPYAVDRPKKLEIHMRKHTGERPYSCPKCPYTAAQRSNLNRHMLRHDETLLVKCPFCPYQAELQNVMDSHVASSHP